MAESGCGICLESGREVFALGAPVGEADVEHPHLYCGSCWLQYLKGEFITKRKSFLFINCPFPNCPRKLGEEGLRAGLKADPGALLELEEVLKTIPTTLPPTRLGDFNYSYNSRGELLNCSTGKKFHFINQAHYDALGDFVTSYIQQLLIKKCLLEEVLLPLSPQEGPKTNIFLSPDALTNPDRLMLLIQGSGAVRPGQWARALCINDNLAVGSMIPYVLRAKANGFGVIIFNPNNNYHNPPQEIKREMFFSTAKGSVFSSLPDRQEIPQNQSPRAHSTYVWDNFVTKAAAKQIVIVAHSAGGACTLYLLKERAKEFQERVKGIAFTDSAHSVYPDDPPFVKTFIKGNAVDWVTSSDPLDTPVKDQYSSYAGCPCVSAGHTKHEWTSGTSIESVFKFLCSRVDMEYAPFQETGENIYLLE